MGLTSRWYGSKCNNSSLVFLTTDLSHMGRSDKYLAYNHFFFWKCGDFISQYSLLLIPYTWPSNAQTSLTHLKNMTISIDSNFCPASDFIKFENKKNCTGPNLENMVDGAAIPSAIRPIWPWWWQRCEPVHSHGGRAFFLRQIGPVFLQFGVESAQWFGIVEPCDCFALFQVVDIDHT